MKPQTGFTLVELLLVVALLALVAAVVCVSYRGAVRTAGEAVVASEMTAVLDAFTRFRADCSPSDSGPVKAYGLWPLMTREHPDGGTDYAAYDFRAGGGWAGPYVIAEGTAWIDPDGPGQPSRREADGGVRVPVVLTPSGDRYRVMAPQDGDGPILGRLLLVSLGAWRDLSWDEDTTIQEETELLEGIQEELDDRLATPTGTDLEAELRELQDAFPRCTFTWLTPDLLDREEP
jgi:prepilin-type N-terminal cleavage/methylation domain-containing protein